VSVDTDVEFRRLHPLTPLAKGWTIMAFVAIAFISEVLGGGDEGDDGLGWLVAVALAAIPIAVVYGLMSWWFTRYAIVDDDLRVETGLVFRRSRVVDLERLQSVDIVQQLVPRILGLAELRLEVAGGSSTEAPLAFLSVSDAHALRAELLARRGRGGVAGAVEAPSPLEERVLVRVPVDQLAISALLSGAWLATVVVAALAVLDAVLSRRGGFVGLLFPALLGAIRGVRSFLGDYDFTVSEADDGLRIRRGLLDTRLQTVPEGRIQAVRISRPLLWRPLGWVRVNINVAGYAATGDNDQLAKTSTLLPVAPAAVAHDLVRRAVPNLTIDEARLVPAPRRARWINPVGFSGLGATMTDYAVIGREGLMGRDLSAIPLSKPQSVHIAPGPLQRRLRLATVHIDTTPGPVRVRARDRDPADARQLFDAVVTRLRAALPSRPARQVPARPAPSPPMPAPASGSPPSSTNR
jgi:putative membrane protein